jgi:hypothetical protein
MIKYFTIYGERCSGTNFLMNAILNNFDIKYTTKYSWKHFFGFYDFNDSFQNSDENNEIFFIGIIRDPISWIDSFYKKMHHIPNENRRTIHTFLFNEFYSIYDDTMTEIMEDRNFITNKRYKNIFELRKVKNNFLINDMPKKVKNYLLIRYEDIRDNYEIILEYFHIKFKLNKKNNKYIKINNYKGIKNYRFFIREIKLSKNIIKKIKNNLDLEQEKSLGYLYK